VRSALFGSRRAAAPSREPALSLDDALAPALESGHWRVPRSFNFTRDVVEVLARDPRRHALTVVGRDGIIEHRSFEQLAHGAARWATCLREHGVGPGDPLLVLVEASPDWAEVMLAGIKVGAVTVPCPPELTAAGLDIRMAATRASLVVAGSAAEATLAGAESTSRVLLVEDVHQRARHLPKEAPTHDTRVRDAALIVTTTGRTNGPRGVLHTHASAFAARLHAEHWLGAEEGDVVWCTAPVDSPQTMWSSLFGPWSRGASVVLHDGGFDPIERLELLDKLRVTVLCQTPDEYRALAESGRLGRYVWARPRRLVSTGGVLSDEVPAAFEEAWRLPIHDGYGQAETGIVVGHPAGEEPCYGPIGRPLPGYDVTVVDEDGKELPPGFEGDIALRGNPPSLFSRYWNAPDETNAAYRGDWYVTGDLGVRDEDGFLWLLGRAVPSQRRAHAVATAPPPEDSHEAGRREAVLASAAAVPAQPPPVVEPVRVEQPPPSQPASPARAPEPAPAPAPTVQERRVPILARITATLWILVLGVMIGGVAIPHAQDKPRVVPKSEDVPSSICLPPPAPRK
jgi:acyl-coenzyme A synthetase/AMP-(fatty) acid ligase